MSNPWIRLYRDSLHNPKIVSLNDRQHRIWHNLLLVADDAGELPRVRDIACHLRLSIAEVEQLLAELVEAELIDMAIDGPRKFRLHDWATHQYISDTSTDRVRKFRNKNKASNDETFHETQRNVSVTPPDTDTDSDTDYVSSSESMPREKQEQSSDLSFGRTGSGKKGSQERLVERAIGFGVDADQLIAVMTKQPRVKNRAAYFTTLFANEIARRLPGINTDLVRDALWDKGDAAGTLYDLLMRAEAA